MVSHIATLDTTNKTWDKVTELYQNATTNKKLILRENQRNTNMNKWESVVIYLTKVRATRDELVAVSDKPFDDDLVRITLNGFSKQWDVFIQVINGRD